MKKIVGIIIGSILLVAFFIISEVTIEEEKIKIGVLMTGHNRINKLEGLKEGLVDLGYDLEKFQFFVEEAGDDSSRLEELASSLLKKELDVIASFGGIETQALKQVLDDESEYVPVVFIGMAAPLELGIIEDYRQPNGYFTGINNYHMSLSAKRLELFVDLVPKLERVIVLYSEDIDISRLSMEVTKEAASHLGVTIFPVNITNKESLSTLEEVITAHDGILVLPSFHIESLTDEIVDIADLASIPSMGIYEYEVEMGYLVSYGSSFFQQGFQAARHVSLILQGNHPKNIPVELPDHMGFYVNESKMTMLGIQLDNNLLKLAEVIIGGEIP